MQDLEPIPGMGGLVFTSTDVSNGGDHNMTGLGTAAGYVDRRHHRPHPAAQQQQQNLKCPRCDSPNTKFCYYNNYNLSQPRHFCKSCRRYWTKGGVLRNVPVGGGCRKSKRSAASSSPTSSSKSAKGDQPHRSRPSTASHSSSDSSGLTAGNTVDGFVDPDPSPVLDHQTDHFMESTDQVTPTATEIFLDTDTVSTTFAGMFTTEANPTTLDCNFSDLSSFRLPAPAEQQEQKVGGVAEELKVQEMTAVGGYMDQTVPIDFSWLDGIKVESTTAGGLNGLDWPSCQDPTAEIFDSSVAVDQGGLWNQSHWGDTTDPSLYLP